MSIAKPIVPVLLEKVYALIDEKLDESQQSLVKTLGEKLLTLLDDNDLFERNESDLYGALISLWQHLNDNHNNAISVRVFNPTLAQHGWQSTHTVVEIVCPDRPFIVESVRIALNQNELTTHLMLNGPHRFCRDNEGRIEKVCEDTGALLSIFHVEVDRITDDKQIQNLTQELESVLNDVDIVVEDWAAMNGQLEKIKAELHKVPGPADTHERDEVLEFLSWIGHGNYTFLGYQYFHLNGLEGDYQLVPDNQQGLGLFRRKGRARKMKLSVLPESARQAAKEAQLLLLTKGNTQSKIHRPVYTDYIGIKTFDESDNVTGEHRFIGLYTSSAYLQSIDNIPLLNKKIARVLALSGYSSHSHSWKAMRNILETFPRDELFQATETEMLEVGNGVLRMQDRDLLRIFIRKDLFGRYFSCMVYTSKERYNTQLRRKTQQILADYFNTEQEVEFNTYFTDSALARTHYIVRVNDNSIDIDASLLERNLAEAASSWDDRLRGALISHVGENDGAPIFKRFARGFSRSYQENALPGIAVADIQQLLALNDEQQLGMSLYRPQEERSDSKVLKLKLYHREQPIHLSDVMPILENLGLRVIGEKPYKITTRFDETFWILDFEMHHNLASVDDLSDLRARFQEAFSGIWQRNYESDGFNQLILTAGMTGKEVSLIRAYAKYMQQVRFPFGQEYIQQTLNAYPTICALLVALFKQRFDPALKRSDKAIEGLQQKIIDSLEHVESLDDDRILRRYVDLISATLRTNYFQQGKPSLALKLTPALIPEVPQPIPAFEIFVYSPDIEGVHLRGGKVARGGLRWSDRREDFRTEILGLVKAQQVKNTVIVPVGAKGGFVCKRQPFLTERQAILAEGKRCYCIFIQALLDVADNIIDGKLIPPVNVVRHDDDDPYLVVAADKGTATFSDLANAVSADNHFWLGDAFASGGSNGYDHKAMGITAKGAWESVKRHFREMGIDCQTTDFSAIGIGDMGGDVFGNGMLLSRHIRLQAAFNHLHIFIDPDPDASISYQERERLFNTQGSAWSDYDPVLISAGGGIFSRKAKSIPLSNEMQKLLGTRKQNMTPNELISAILTMPADLLWNGGIGTYVKASTESHTEVGDRANDALRVDGSALRVKVVGEGGNLGMTQLARIEFAKHGGRVNTDFVDNVGGVDCSDNEVNIKILLNGLVAGGDLTLKRRNALLASMEDQVSDIVLEDAYLQAESLSVTTHTAAEALKEHTRFIHHLEREGVLNRALEYLPDDEALLAREKEGLGLTRPEHSVLLAYAKMVLKEQLVSDHIAENPYFARYLPGYFPKELQEHYRSVMASHPLRREIIATCLANQIANDMGCNFVLRMQEETGAELNAIAEAYAVAREIFHIPQILEQIRQLDNHVTADIQYALLFDCRRMLRRATRWLLRAKERVGIEEQIALYQPVINDVTHNIERYLVAEEQQEHQNVAEKYVVAGVPKALADLVSRMSSLYSALDIAQIASQSQQDVEYISRVYFYMGARLSLHWFLQQINQQRVENHWQALARATFREDLDYQQRLLTQAIVSQKAVKGDADKLVEQWIETNQSAIARWESILAEFRVGSTHEFAKFSVAMRELVLLHLNCTD
uniref:NAD-glutamate dehydrogenase n=1 Tax=Thaumasiovibrio occultus TaxID=1891184 RepID=UPI000B35E8F1|nr:NAD-glutamate dehydrogenase [Thaumasiovibrio occultus]